MSRMKAMNKIVQFETPEQKADRLETEVKELKAEVESLKRDLSHAIRIMSEISDEARLALLKP
jgi:outer membrane murein-binding lipoprotein Lpp